MDCKDIEKIDSKTLDEAARKIELLKECKKLSGSLPVDEISSKMHNINEILAGSGIATAIIAIVVVLLTLFAIFMFFYFINKKYKNNENYKKITKLLSPFRFLDTIAYFLGFHLLFDSIKIITKSEPSVKDKENIETAVGTAPLETEVQSKDFYKKSRLKKFMDDKNKEMDEKMINLSKI